jgi:hypothetical protein
MRQNGVRPSRSRYQLIMTDGIGVWVHPVNPSKQAAIVEALVDAGVRVNNGPHGRAIGNSVPQWYTFLDGSWEEYLRYLAVGVGGQLLVSSGKTVKNLFAKIFHAKDEAGDPPSVVTFVDNSTNVWIAIRPNDLDLPDSEWDKLVQLKPEEHAKADGRPSSVVHEDPDGGWVRPN